MSCSKYNCPVFETLVLHTEIEYNDEPYLKLSPAKAGDSLTNLAIQFNHQQNNIGNPIVFQNSFHASNASKIQVVYFYSSQWGETSLSHLKQLHALRNEVKYHDGNL